MALSVPALCESQLGGRAESARLAIMIDLLQEMIEQGVDSAETPLVSSSGNVANATAAATLVALATGQTAYLTGFEITGSGATVGTPVTVTITGILGGTLSYTYAAIAGALLPNQPLIVEFTTPIPASAINTNIVVSCPALGAGNTNNTVVAHGFRV